MENENYCINYCINCGRKLRRHELITCDICEDLSVITNQYVNTYNDDDNNRHTNVFISPSKGESQHDRNGKN